MTTAFTALSGSRFWSRHVLLRGSKLQNTNRTNTFSTAVTRLKQQTSGRLRTANNTIAKCFFQIHAPGKCFISSFTFKFWWYTFHRQDKFSRAKNISYDLHCNDSTNLLSLATSVCQCISGVNSFHREYRLNTPTFLWDYSHIVPLNQIEVTSETWTSIVNNLVVSGASGVM